MISLIVHHDPFVRDAFVRALAMEKKEDINDTVSYQNGKWIFVLVHAGITEKKITELLELYQPERVYLPSFGRSIDMTHEEGDVVLPNVFLEYNPEILTVSLDETNRDSLMGTARFLEVYDDQRDYYVEDFGLSVGGIVVSNVPETYDQDHLDALMMVYEADVYLSEDLGRKVDIIAQDLVPTVITLGIIDGKKSRAISGSVIDVTARNMVTTWRLMQEDET